jgi:UDP-2-acetamido-3-amino-2,3-dideoxy-glucuronate N-acetyltransferase
VEDVLIHPTAEVAPDARIGRGTRIWNQSQVRAGAQIGAECNLGKNVYIDFDVVIGERVKIQNNVSVYHGVTLEDGIFIGPHVCFTNDVLPRAITSGGQVKSQDDWVVGSILVRSGASIGAGSIILPNVTIGQFALIGAGSVVTHSVPAHALVYGNPARQHGYVCHCGQRLMNVEQISSALDGFCLSCDKHVKMPIPGIPRAGSESQPDNRLFV